METFLPALRTVVSTLLSLLTALLVIRNLLTMFGLETGLTKFAKYATDPFVWPIQAKIDKTPLANLPIDLAGLITMLLVDIVIIILSAISTVN